MGAAVAGVYGKSHVAGWSEAQSGILSQVAPAPDFASLHPGYGALHSCHHHVFDLDIFFHAVMRAFASQAALLHAAERRHFRRDQAGVDADHAGLQRVRLYIRKHRRLEEAAAERMALAAGDDLGAALDRVGNVLLDLVDRLHVDQRALHHAGFGAVADLHRRDLLRKLFDELVVNLALGVEA